MERLQSLPHVHIQPEHQVIHLAMTSEERQKVRRKLTASDGMELALELPTGTTLHVGQVLFQQNNTVYVVSAAPEDVLLVRPRNLQEAAQVGHMIGNLHRDVDISEDGIAALWDAPLERKLEQAGFYFTRTSRPFRGKPVGEHSH
jgi:urease accessory protein